MENKWKNKIVLITGSSMGIGKKLAFEIGKKGGKIILNSRNTEILNKTLKEIQDTKVDAIAISGDVSKYEDCEKIVKNATEKYGKIDVLLNNAGIASHSTFEELDPKVFQNVVNVNLLGSVNMTKATLPFIKKSNGSIFFISSIAGIHGLGEYSAYSCSKMALTSFVESLRIELHDTGVHVGIAYIGFTENDIEKSFLNKDGMPIPVPSRENTKQMTQIRVARKIMRLIECRKYSSTFSFLGKLNSVMNRFFPILVHIVLLKAYKKNKS